MSIKQRLTNGVLQLAQGVGEHLQKVSGDTPDPGTAGKSSRLLADDSPAMVLTPQSREIRAYRAKLHEKIGISAHLGSVADALPLALYANHGAELSEIHRQLGEEEAGYQARLRHLDALFPVPPALAPQPPPPRSPQFFPRLGKLLGQRSRPHSGMLN